ncbi:hypothetical protein [Bradyrhizobium sp. USDA 4454]
MLQEPPDRFQRKLPRRAIVDPSSGVAVMEHLKADAMRHQELAALGGQRLVIADKVRPWSR